MKDPKLEALRNKQIGILDRKIMGLKLIWDNKKLILENKDIKECGYVDIETLFTLIPKLEKTLPDDDYFIDLLRDNLYAVLKDSRTVNSFANNYLT